MISQRINEVCRDFGLTDQQVMNIIYSMVESGYTLENAMKHLREKCKTLVNMGLQEAK